MDLGLTRKKFLAKVEKNGVNRRAEHCIFVLLKLLGSKFQERS